MTRALEKQGTSVLLNWSRGERLQQRDVHTDDPLFVSCASLLPGCLEIVAKYRVKPCLVVSTNKYSLFEHL